MKIEINKVNGNLKVALDGRLDTTTAPELESVIAKNLDGIDYIDFDCKGLTYVSSAGLRVLLSAHKRMMGALTLTNVCELVMEVFEITGFVDVLNVK